MITIHHLLVSQSERVIWLMEELGLPYELKTYPRDPATRMAPPALLDVHPLGQAPVIEDGDVVLAESLAIAIYILELYGDGPLRIAPGEPGYPDYLYWLCYSIGGLMPQAMQHMAAAGAGDDDSPRAAVMRERKQRHLGMIAARLETNDWLAGDTFTAADIMCHFPFGTCRGSRRSTSPAIRRSAGGSTGSARVQPTSGRPRPRDTKPTRRRAAARSDSFENGTASWKHVNLEPRGSRCRPSGWAA